MTREPDFILIGAMKAGTTSLFAWLGSQPEFALPRVKEPDFFSNEAVFRRGLRWYGEQFAGASRAKITGEASVSYTDPAFALKVAKRISISLDDRVRLIFLSRDRVQRLQSHYSHAVRRGRERRRLVDVLSVPDNEYVSRSCYSDCLAPYLEHFPPSRLLIVDSAAVFAVGNPGWHEIISYFGLPCRDAPRLNVNNSEMMLGFNRGARLLWEAGVLARLRESAPRQLRSLARSTLRSATTRYLELRADAINTRMTAEVDALFARDAARMEHMVDEWRRGYTSGPVRS